VGGTKSLIDDWEHQEHVARSIAIEAEVMDTCEVHGTAFVTGLEVENAYRVANARYSSGQYHDVFASRREMTDAIKRVVDNSYVECSLCEKMMAD